MAQAATNPKIEELRGRLKADPRSRLFYPLAEELRKVNSYDEAESVLRTGLSSHPTYLSAWVSLGRVLRDQKKNADATEALKKALQLDPGNVVAARLLADAYLELGEKVEAIKKYKLVYALLPSDDELEGTIAKLEAEINAPSIISEPDSPFELDSAGHTTTIQPTSADAERVFDETGSHVLKNQKTLDIETGDVEPMRAAHLQSPFEEPGAIEGYGSDAFSIEQPGGMHVASAPMSADLPMPLPTFDMPPAESAPVRSQEPATPADEADVFEPAGGGSGIAPGFVTTGFAVTSSMSPLDEADFARTIKMADLYAMEGSIDEARDIYEDLLARDPNNAMLRSKLDALGSSSSAGASPEAEPVEKPAAPPSPAPVSVPLSAAPARNPKVEKLESWLSRVKRV